MVSVPFDTHRVVKNLQDAGFDQTRAEALVNAIRYAVSCRDTRRTAVKTQDLKNFDVKQDFVGVRQEIAAFRTELKAFELRLTLKLTTAIIVTTSITIAILKLFP